MRACMSGIIIALVLVGYLAIIASFSHVDLAMGDTLFEIGRFLGAFFFGTTLMFIYFSRSELLTSNMMVACIGLYYRRLSLKSFGRILSLCYAGNLLGGLLVTGLLAMSTIITPDMQAVMVKTIQAKTAYLDGGLFGFSDLLVRAIFCNFFINLAMLCAYSGNVTSDGTKCFAMYIGIFTFMYLGFEHSVANSMLFLLGSVFMEGMPYWDALMNVLVVLIGNFIGGGILIGIYYSYVNDEKFHERRKEAKQNKQAAAD